ncbi:MAG: leucyl/phenylalanyl-tRNA--protein transferase [Pirellulales bacterium]|nr:leucyl/phenylalanyl-tRNA--protein transferase [Pirellulales bacterium]
MKQLPPAKYFPPAEAATDDGLVGVGGSLEAEWLLDAYSHGIFPWPVGEEDDPMLWWSLDPRAIFELDGFHVSRRLQRTCRSGRFTLTCDQDFSGVIHGCAYGPSRDGGTWITPSMIEAYTRMHHLGHAHSIEAWHEGQLAGGVYGIAIAGLFAAESMFYLQRDASKVALVGLIGHLRARGYMLFDIQQLTPHTERLGAVEIPRGEYLTRLADALQAKVTFGNELECMVPDTGNA